MPILMKAIISLFKTNKDLLLFIVLMVVFRSSFADINRVPTGSMQPTIVEGDRIVVNKLAYDIQLPLLQTKLLKLDDPKRGDIIIFESKVSNNRLVKRVIGIPGDIISMQGNQLTINGTSLKYSQGYSDPHSSNVDTPLSANPDRISLNQYTDLNEDLLGLNHRVRIHRYGSSSANFNSVTVPKGYYLALGDNRDRSADSRVIGLIPRKEIIGRSQRTLMSLDPENYYVPRLDRFFKVL